MIRKIMAIAIAILLISGVMAMAETTTGANWNEDLGWANDLRDYVAGHDHGYTDRYNDYERNNPIGLGLDVIVYEFDGVFQQYGLDTVEVQQKFDFNNTEYSVYGVVKVNAWRPLKKWLGVK